MTTALMVKVSPALKEAIDKAAEQADMNMSEFVREKVAAAIGYDLSSDDALDGRGRPKVYQSEEQRKKARRDAERERQQHRREVHKAMERKAREDGAASLEAWLVARGIPIDDAPVAEAV